MQLLFIILYIVNSPGMKIIISQLTAIRKQWTNRVKSEGNNNLLRRVQIQGFKALTQWMDQPAPSPGKCAQERLHRGAKGLLETAFKAFKL